MLQDSIAALAVEITAADLGTPAVLDQFRIAYLGRKGRLADFFDQLKTVPADERRAVGQQLNALKQAAQTRHDAAHAALEATTATPPGNRPRQPRRRSWVRLYPAARPARPGHPPPAEPGARGNAPHLRPHRLRRGRRPRN